MGDIMRVTTSKSKNAESFYINHAYIDENGKSTSRIYKKLGTLKELSEKLGTDRDIVMAWTREQARIATEEYKKENEAISVSLFPNRILDKDQNRTFNSGYLFYSPSIIISDWIKFAGTSEEVMTISMI